MDEQTIMTLVTVLFGGTGLLGWYKVFTEAKQIRKAAETAREALAETAETTPDDKLKYPAGTFYRM